MLVLEAQETRLLAGGTGDVVGQPTVGAAPDPGALVWVVRRHERPLRARVLESRALANGRVRLVIEGWGRDPLAPGHGIATDPALLVPWPALPPELAADR